MADLKISQLPAVVTPAGSDEFAVNQGGTTKKETLTQVKTFSNTSPTITGGTIDNTVIGGTTQAAGTFTSLKIDDSTASFTMEINPSTAFTADRVLNFNLVDADRTITLTGNPSLDDWFDQSVKTNADPLFNSIDVTDAATSRTNLGLGTIATQNASAVTITGGTLDGISIGATVRATGDFTTLGVEDVSTNFEMLIGVGSTYTANRTLTFTTGDADRTLTLSANVELNQNLLTSSSPSFTAVTVAPSGLRLETPDTTDVLIITPSTNFAMNRTLSIDVADADRTLTLNANVALNQDVETTDKPSFAGLTLTNALDFDRTATAVTVSSANESIIGVTSTAAPRTITLSTSDVVEGRLIMIKDESGGAASNNITINTQAAETIDGAATATITEDSGYRILYSDGSNWFVVSSSAITLTRTSFFSPQQNTSYNLYRTRSLGASASWDFSFATPEDFGSLVSVEAVVAPVGAAAGSGKDIDLSSTYGGFSQSTTQFNETDTTSTFDLGTADQWTTIDLSSVFTSLAASQTCGVEIDHQGVGGTVHYAFIKLVYNVI